MDKVLEFLKKNPTYFLATCDGDQPESRPFGTIARFEDKLYIQTGRSKNVFKQIEANPKINICGWDPEAGAWLRIDATAVIDDRDEASEAVLSEYPNLRALYAPGDGNCVVFYLKDATARFCSFTAPEEVHTF